MKTIILGVLLLASNAGAIDVKSGGTLGRLSVGGDGLTLTADTTNKRVGFGTVTPSVGVEGLNKKLQFDYLDDTAAADGTYYNLFRATAGASSPAAAAEVGVLSGQYNWYKGDNQNFIANGIEGVVRSRGADESMTARGVYGRVYIDPDYSATLRTGIAGEFSARASYSGGTDIVAESGTAFVGVRSWMAPYFTAASTPNINNFHAFWGYNEHTTVPVTNGLKLASAGGGFTNDLNLQNGATIDNVVSGTMNLKATNVAVPGNGFAVGTQTFTVVAGRVGIGTTAPATPLDVNGAATVRGAAVFTASTTLQGNVKIEGASAVAITNGLNAASLYASNSGNANTASVQLVGNANHGFYGAANSHVSNTVGGTTVWRSSSTGAFYVNPLSVYASTFTSLGDLSIPGVFTQTGALNCSLGPVITSTGALIGCVASDRRLKSDISSLSYNPNLIDELRPVSYRWRGARDDGRLHAGFIAQEVEAVFPKAVVPGGGKDLKAVDSNAILAALLQEVQALRKRVALLEAKK